MAKVFGLVALGLAMGIGSGCASNNDASKLIHTQFGSFDPTANKLPELHQGLTQSNNVAPVPHIVQFVDVIQAPWRAEIERAGLEVRGYMPDNALIVVATSTQAEQLRALPFVRAVVEQPRLLKIDRRLVRQREKQFQLMAMRSVEDLLVEMTSANARADVEAAVQAAGGTVVRRVATVPGQKKILHVTMPVAGVDRLAARADVVAVGLYFRPQLFNDRSYGVVQAGKAEKSPLWDHGLHGGNQIVAVADTGLFTTSCFFNTGDKVVGYEDVAATGDGDGHGHGTHVAGSIAGDNFGNGVHDSHDGMAPAARLYIQDVADGGDLIGLDDDLEPLFKAAYDNGARIHSDSWGDEDNTYSIIARSVDQFVADHHDFLVLFANGNSGEYGESTVGSPATAKNIISVGALNGSEPEDITWFSSKGPTADGRIKPTLSAPGLAVVSAKNSGTCDTRAMSGTSMATPTLAGASALVREYFTDGYYPTGKATSSDAFTPSAALLKAVMLAGADDMRGEETGGHFPAVGQGFGRAHLANGLPFAGDKRSLTVEDHSAGLETGGSADYLVTVQKGQSLRVALTWTDPPAAVGAEKVLVNDLDLIVTGPNGTYHGNVLEAGKSALADNSDTINVEEVVSLDEAPRGTYYVQVRGTNVPMGPQAFAVAIVTH